MLVKLVDEVALDWFESLVHAIQHEIVPIRRQAHELAERSWVILNQSEGDGTIQRVVFTAELDRSLPLLWLLSWIADQVILRRQAMLVVDHRRCILCLLVKRL